MRGGLLLAVESRAARTAGSLSRLFGAGGGTTLPGKLLWRTHPGAVDRLAGLLPRGAALVSATNGKTTSTAMAAAILGRRVRLAHNASGANLVSGIASTLLAEPGAELGLFEVDEAALPEVWRRVRPRVVAFGNLFRDQLDRYGELELVGERWRAAAEAAPETQLVVNADDPLLGELVRDLPAGRVLTYGLDDPAQARPSLQHAADSKYCPLDGTPYEYRAAYVGHLGDYRCPACGRERLPLAVAARALEPRGLDGVGFRLETPEGDATVHLRVPGLYNVYNAAGAAALALSLGAGLGEVVAGLEGFTAAFGRFERIPAHGRSLLLLLVKNPAGANEAIRTLLDGGAPRLVVVALNDEIADGRDVSWIWDVDFEPLLTGLDRAVVAGGRAAELALRVAYGGLPRGQIEVVPDLEQALDRGLALTPAGGELVVLPTYTAMLALRRIAVKRGLAADYWRRAA